MPPARIEASPFVVRAICSTVVSPTGVRPAAWRSASLKTSVRAIVGRAGRQQPVGPPIGSVAGSSVVGGLAGQRPVHSGQRPRLACLRTALILALAVGFPLDHRGVKGCRVPVRPSHASNCPCSRNE